MSCNLHLRAELLQPNLRLKGEITRFEKNYDTRDRLIRYSFQVVITPVGSPLRSLSRV